MKNEEIPHFAATVGIEILTLLWNRRSWIEPDMIAEREILAAGANKMLERLKNYKPYLVTKIINMNVEQLSTDTIDAGLQACVEILRKPRFHGNLGTDPNVRKIIAMTLGEVRYGRKIVTEINNIR